MKKVIFTLILLSSSFIGLTQKSEKQEKIAVRKAIDTMFDAMREGDSSKLKSVMYEHLGLMTTYTDKNGVPKLHVEAADDFVAAVGTPHKEVWDERISKVKITIDGNLAQAWMNYEFYLDDKFSHKGVNAFQLFRSPDGWKIIQIPDTRRTKD